MPGVSTEIPECLRHLPFDERRKLPVPFMNMIGDGLWDFTTITGPQVVRCIKERLCGVCGKPLDYWVAFIGNEKAGATCIFTDPPMHESCALASLGLCPMINHGNMSRAKGPRVKNDDLIISPNFSRERPVAWMMPVTQRYHVESHDGYLLFFSGPYKRVRVWRNKEDGPGLVELGTQEVDQLLSADCVSLRR